MINPSITVDYQDQDQFICGVEIAFADGNARSYKFDVSVSNDTSNFMQIISGKSNGTTTGFQKYLLPWEINARFVKVTITESHFGSANSIAQISELRSTGKFSVVLPPGTGCPPICFPPG